ncbi:hypothetical protein OROMI_013473 [Orobanche minor]
MEGEGDNRHYESMEYNPNSLPTHANDRGSWVRHNHQKLLNLPVAVTLSEPNVNSSRSGDEISDGGMKYKWEGSSCASWVKGQWTSEEDRKLVELVKQYGLRKWAVIAQHMVGRIGKQCRERWQNHLRPDIKKSLFWTEEEEKLIIEAHEKFGNKWAEIAKCITGRSENAIKNHWNATIRKQSSKRKIRRPERLRGLLQSTVLEEYIKKKQLDKVSSSNNTTPHQMTVTSPLINPLARKYNNYSLINDIYDDETTTYFSMEAFNEEMNFMKNLFAKKEKIIHNNNNNNNSRSNISEDDQFSAIWG